MQFYEKEKVMKKRKLLPVLLALAMVLTMIPASVFADGEDPTVAIGGFDGDVVAGQQYEFSVTTAKGNIEGNTMVKGIFEYSGTAKIEKLEYLETKDDQWYELTGYSFGPAGGFPLIDGTSKFRVTFKNAGDFNFTVNIVTVDNNSTIATVTKELTVVPAPAADVIISDFGPFNSESLGENSYSLGWQYINGFNTDEITGIRVGIINLKGQNIVEYTADVEQLTWQAENGYINNNQSSAPFYKTLADGTGISEGRDLDWTVIKGEAFDEWAPAVAYVEVKTADKTYYKEYTYKTCTHENVVHIEKKDPTADKSGNIEYWYCNTCDKYFSNEELTVEISLEDTVLPAIGETSEESKDNNDKDNGPKTGDDFNMAIPFAAAGLALAAMAAVVATRKRHN